MAVGVQQNKAQLDGACSLFITLENLMSQFERIKAFLDATSNGTLQAAPYGYSVSPDEVAILKSAFADAAQLAAIYRGTQALAVAKDFRTFSKLTIGTGL